MFWLLSAFVPTLIYGMILSLIARYRAKLPNKIRDYLNNLLFKQNTIYDISKRVDREMFLGTNALLFLISLLIPCAIILVIIFHFLIVLYHSVKDPIKNLYNKWLEFISYVEPDKEKVITNNDVEYRK